MELKKAVSIICSSMIIISLGKLNNEDIRSKVKNIVNGNRVNGKIDIPNELEFLPEYYEHPSSKLFTDEEISLTCLGNIK